MSSGRDHDLEKPDAQPGGSAFHRASAGGREIDVRPGKSPRRLMHSNVRPHHGEIQNLMSAPGQTRLRRAPGRRAYSRPVLLRVSGPISVRSDRGSLGPKAVIHATGYTWAISAVVICQAATATRASLLMQYDIRSALSDRLLGRHKRDIRAARSRIISARPLRNPVYPPTGRLSPCCYSIHECFQRRQTPAIRPRHADKSWSPTRAS